MCWCDYVDNKPREFGAMLLHSVGTWNLRDIVDLQCHNNVEDRDAGVELKIRQ